MDTWTIDKSDCRGAAQVQPSTCNWAYNPTNALCQTNMGPEKRSFEDYCLLQRGSLPASMLVWRSVVLLAGLTRVISELRGLVTKSNEPPSMACKKARPISSGSLVKWFRHEKIKNQKIKLQSQTTLTPEPQVSRSKFGNSSSPEGIQTSQRSCKETFRMHHRTT